ncbi:MAG TPA: transposase [Caulobacteraceae bacterium]|nr:transposase [Caulobacteraceae bacterium]
MADDTNIKLDPHAGWRSRGYLPHYDASETVQHVVFRLADSLPAEVMRRLEKAPKRVRLETAEATLDSGIGSRLLAEPHAADIVQAALLHFDAERYRLLAWCVMPTHVHVVVEQMTDWPLAAVVHSWKSFTAHSINRRMRRSGAVWAREYFDRMMRDDRQVEAARFYIENNPVSANLCAAIADWPWSSACRRLKQDAGETPALRS